jgi:hypothetical protein
MQLDFSTWKMATMIKTLIITDRQWQDRRGQAMDLHESALPSGSHFAFRS